MVIREWQSGLAASLMQIHDNDGAEVVTSHIGSTTFDRLDRRASIGAG